MGLATVLGLSRRGFFIPHRYAKDLPGPGERAPYEAIAALFARHEDDFAATLAKIETQQDTLRALGDEPPPAPRWRQDWFPRLDAAAAYVLTGELRPARIVEVGSGHSTRFLCRAIADGGLPTRLTAIDPAPRAALAGLDIEWVPTPVHQAGMGPFAELAPGDFVFVDSSHILMPGSDVDWILNHVLPALPAGVRVHFHDVFLPDDYPAEWDWRAYNEQLALAPLLTGRAYRTLFASHYAATRMRALIDSGSVTSLPLLPGAHESSLWLEKG